MEIIDEQNLITNIFLPSKSSKYELIYQTSSDYLSSDEEINFNKKKISSINYINKIEINDVNKNFIDYNKSLQYEKIINYEETIKKRIIINRRNILLIKGKK